MKKATIVIVFLLVILGSLFIIARIAYQRAFQGEEDEDLVPTPTVVLPTITDNIIVDLKSKEGNQIVILKIKGLTADIQSIEYELTYMTGGGLPRGVLGKISLKGEDEIIRDDIVLGTCSSGKCVYDTGVKEINLSLKFNTTSGAKVFQKTYLL